jgi:MFS family permease
MGGLFVMALCTVLFASASYFEGKWVFYTISTAGRMVQGVADSLICVAIPSLIAIKFPENNAKYQGYLECAMGIGMAFGPVMSSFIYEYLEYRGTFFFYAVFIIVMGLTPACFIPGEIDNLKNAVPDIELVSPEKAKNMDWSSPQSSDLVQLELT